MHHRAASDAVGVRAGIATMTNLMEDARKRCGERRSCTHTRSLLLSSLTNADAHSDMRSSMRTTADSSPSGEHFRPLPADPSELRRRRRLHGCRCRVAQDGVEATRPYAHAQSHGW